MKKALATLLFSLNIFSISSPLFAMSQNIIAKAEEAIDTTNIYETDVLDDLSNLSSFQVESYNETDFSFIYFAEYNYSKTTSNGFNLFLYFYSNTSFVLGDKDAYVNMRNATTSLTYHENYLQIVDETSGFYKALVLNPKTFYSPYKIERKYDIAGLSINTVENGAKNYHDNTIGKTYTIRGSAAGIDGNTNSTLSVHTHELQTISISLKGGTWHTASNFGDRNSLFYVWFGLDKDFSNDGWFLKKIHYEYYQLKLNTLYAGIDNSREYDSYSYFESHWDDTLGTVVGTQVVTYWYCRLIGQRSQTRHTLRSNEIINDINLDHTRRFSIDTMDDFVSQNRIKTKVDEYYSSVVQSADFFEFDEENTDKNISVPASNLNGFEQWWLKYIRNVSGGNSNLDQYDTFKAWTVVDGNDSSLTDSEFSTKYFVSDNQASELKHDLFNNTNSNKDTYLFRFTILPYFSDNVIADWNYAVPGGPEPNIDHSDHLCGYYFDSYYIKDFDIIDFTFENDNAEITVIPVVADPIDVADQGQKSDTYVWDWKSEFNWLYRIIAIVLIVIAAIFVLWLLFKIIKWARKAFKD
ncbi:MAG: hypothetical protein IKB70_07070 [Bacilli bacterium]|nr:hypothetical protein [Bacilli bacterium]